MSISRVSALFLSFALCLYVVVATEEPSMVINLFRHGARGPVFNDYNDNKSWKAEDFGLLTPVGMRMHYFLGAALAKTYPHLLGKGYDKEKIYVRTSASSRTFQSLSAQLYGVFGRRKLSPLPANLSAVAVPPYDQTILNLVLQDQQVAPVVNGGFRPSDVIALPADVDHPMKTPETCPKLMASTAIRLGTSDAIKFQFQFWNQAEKELEEAGVDIDSVVDVAELVDRMYTNRWAGFDLPGNLKWGTEAAKTAIFFRDWLFINNQYGSEDQRKYLSIPLFELIIQFLDDKAAGRTQKEFVFLSSHDITLLTVLTALDIVTPECVKQNFLDERAGRPINPVCIFPPFAANLQIEYFNSNGIPKVGMRYNGIPVSICGDGKYKCSLLDFKARVRAVTDGKTTADYKKKCLSSFREKISDIKDLISGKKEMNWNNEIDIVISKLFA